MRAIDRGHSYDRFMDDMEMEDDKDTATVTRRKKMGARSRKVSTVTARGRKSSSMPSRSRKKK